VLDGWLGHRSPQLNHPHPRNPTFNNNLPISTPVPPHRTTTPPPFFRYVRSEILLAGNVMRPHPDDPRKTVLVTLTHINPGGSIDSKAGAAMLNMLTATGPVQFLRRVEAAARKGMEEEAAAGGRRRGWGWGAGGNDPSRTRAELGMGGGGDGEGGGGGLGEQWERLITVV
jgi:hypothetical protein